MTRLDRVLELLEKYDRLASLALEVYSNSQYGLLMLEELRKEKDQLAKELIEHRGEGSVNRISQDIFSEKPKMKKETWSGGGFGI